MRSARLARQVQAHAPAPLGALLEPLGAAGGERRRQLAPRDEAGDRAGDVAIDRGLAVPQPAVEVAHGREVAEVDAAPPGGFRAAELEAAEMAAWFQHARDLG